MSIFTDKVKCQRLEISEAISYSDRPSVPTEYKEPSLCGMAHEIIANLFLGPMETCVSLDALRKNQVTAIVNCCPKIFPNAHEDHIKYSTIVVNDEDHADILQWLHPATSFIQNRLSSLSGEKCLVHCQYGVSRSSTVVIAYLMKYHTMSLNDAYILAKTQRPQVNPNQGFWEQLKVFEKELFDPSSNSLAPPPLNGLAWAETSYVTFNALGRDEDTAFSEFKRCYDLNLAKQALQHGLYLILGKGMNYPELNWYSSLCSEYCELLSHRVEDRAPLSLGDHMSENPAKLAVLNLIMSEDFRDDWGSDFRKEDEEKLLSIFTGMH